VHVAALPHDERTLVDGIPVTSVPRTIFDLAAVLPARRLEQVVNEAEVRRLTDALSVPDLLERYPRRRGTVALRRLYDDRRLDGPTASELEERFLALIDAHGIPRPRLNTDLRLGSGFVRPDCLWAERRLIVELDGRAAHGTPRAFERDRERDRMLTAAGWRVLRVTWRQLRDDPAAVIRDVEVALHA
jgi:very-short-patch-repair endonuclease